jgi:hypothetical protein
MPTHTELGCNILAAFPYGEIMKRVALFLALITLAAAMPIQAQRISPEQNQRQSQKEIKHQQKFLNKANKKQRKAQKKYAKQQRKATQKANRRYKK